MELKVEPILRAFFVQVLITNAALANVPCVVAVAPCRMMVTLWAAVCVRLTAMTEAWRDWLMATRPRLAKATSVHAVIVTGWSAV